MSHGHGKALFTLSPRSEVLGQDRNGDSLSRRGRRVMRLLVAGALGDTCKVSCLWLFILRGLNSHPVKRFLNIKGTDCKN